MISNEELVTRIRAREDPVGNMEQLYLQVKDFIHMIAMRYKALAELEDLEQEGYLALYSAVECYDSSRGVKFLTCAEKWIRQRMKRYVQNSGSCLRLPIHCLENVRRYEKFVSDFAAQYGREPSEQETAALLGCTRKQVRKVQEDVIRTHLESLDRPVMSSEGEESATVGDLVASNEDIESNALDRIQKEELWSCVDSLPGDQPAALRMRYQENMTLRGIGRECGITPEHARQLVGKALRELRKPKYSERLRSFLPEQAYSIALCGVGVGAFSRTQTSSTEKAVLWLEEQEIRHQKQQGLK